VTDPFSSKAHIKRFTTWNSPTSDEWFTFDSRIKKK